jgi:hypothetical protein
VAIAQAAKKGHSAPQPQRVSFNPDTQTSGFLDDVDVQVTDAQTCEFDYIGTQAAQPALCLELTDVNGGQHVQYWTCGQSTDWAPTEDGSGFVSLSGKTGFNAQSNLAMLFKSVVEAAPEIPEVMSILDSGDCKRLIGMKVHVLIKKISRPGLLRTGPNAAKEPTVLLISKIIALPGTESRTAGKVAGKVAGGAKPAGGKPNGAAAAGAGDDIDATLIAALMEALAENDPLPKKSLLQLASGAFKGTPNHSKAIARSNSADFLKSLPDNGINFDGAQFSLA